MYLPQLMQILTISMQTGLRPIMDLDGDTIVTSNTGIILTRSPFPLSALYFSQILWYHVNWKYVLLYNRHIWIKQIKKKIPPLAWMFLLLLLLLLSDRCVLSGRGLCVVLTTRPEDSYGLLCVLKWSLGLGNEETMSHQRLVRHGKKNLFTDLDVN